MAMLEYDPFELLLHRDDDAWPEDILMDAQRAFDMSDPEPLRRLLVSQDPLVQGRGVQLFSVVGWRVKSLWGDAIAAAKHHYWPVRVKLLQGMLDPASRGIDPALLCQLLPLADDEEELVRCNCARLIARSPVPAIALAVDRIEPPDVGNIHRRSAAFLSDASADEQKQLEAALAATSKIESTYRLAAVLRARLKGFDAPLRETHGSALSRCIVSYANLFRTNMRR
jgi:hypothetical protein